MTTAFRNGIRKVAAHLAPDTLGDGELLSRFLSDGDETAFGVLVRRHAAMVFGTCRRVLGNATDADDAFQATFVVLVRKASAFTDRKCIGNFLYGVAYRTALKAREMAARRRKREAAAIPPESTADDSELLKMLDEELAALPDKYREPVVLCELEGKSRREVSERLGIPEGTISSRLAAAHRLLEKRLTARGFAAVSVASLLANSALAVSVELAEVAVLASISQPSASVSLLVTEVMKMMFLSKLKTGAAIVLGMMLLLGSGAVLIPGGGHAQGEEKAKPQVMKLQVPKVEVVKKPSAKEIYALADGEVLKLIPGETYPNDRSEFLDELHPFRSRNTTEGWHLLTTDGKKIKPFHSVSSRMTGPKIGQTIIDSSVSLDALARVVFQLGEQEIYGLSVLDGVNEEMKYYGDVLIRENTPLEKLVPAFQEQLKSKCKIDLKFTYANDERKVVRLSGKMALPADVKVIDLYAVNKRSNFTSSINGGGSQIIASSLSRFIELPVIDESDMKTSDAIVRVNSYKRVPPTVETTASDCDPEKVLKNFAEQTGVTYEFVKRKVRRLIVEKPVATTPK